MEKPIKSAGFTYSRQGAVVILMVSLSLSLCVCVCVCVFAREYLLSLNCSPGKGQTDQIDNEAGPFSSLVAYSWFSLHWAVSPVCLNQAAFPLANLSPLQPLQSWGGHKDNPQHRPRLNKNKLHRRVLTKSRHVSLLNFRIPPQTIRMQVDLT